MLKHTLVEGTQCALWHARISMDDRKTLEERLLGKVNIVYGCAVL